MQYCINIVKPYKKFMSLFDYCWEIKPEVYPFSRSLARLDLYDGGVIVASKYCESDDALRGKFHWNILREYISDYFCNAYRAIRHEDFFCFWGKEAMRLNVGVFSFWHDGPHLCINLYFVSFGWSAAHD